MTTERRSYVVILPDGSESFHDITWDLVHPRWNDNALSDLARKVLRDSGVTTKRSHPMTVEVRVHRLELKDGKVHRLPGSTYRVCPPYAPLTGAEYLAELSEALANLPPEFADYVRAAAWETGHDVGLEEALSRARDIAHELIPVIDKYRRRIGRGNEL